MTKHYTRKLIAVFLFLGIMVSSQLCYAQRNHPYFEHLTIDDRLSSNYVTSIYQDQKGFLWFGTDDGLNKYDGTEITVYRNSANDTNSIKNNYIDAILEDSEDNLLIGTSKGIQIYNWQLDGFTDYKIPGMSVDLKNGNVEGMLFDGENLWVAVENSGLFQINTKTNKIILFQSDSSNPLGLTNNTIEKIYHDNTGQIWVIAGGNLHYIVGNKVVRIAENDIASESVTSILQDSNDFYWIGTAKRGLFKVATTDNFNNVEIIDRYEVDQINPIPYILEINNGDILAALGGQGLAIIPNGEVSFADLFLDGKQANSLNFPTILTIFEDKVGDVWMGTVGGGINVIHQNKQAFDHYSNIPTSKNSIGANDINQFQTDQNGNIWIGTKTGGISKFDLETSSFKNYNADNSFLTSNSVIAIEIDEKGDLWLGGWETGLIHTDKDFRVKEVFNTTNSDLTSNHIFDLTFDLNGNLWIGTLHGGLFMYEPKNKEFSNYLIDGVVNDKSPITLNMHKSGLLFFGGYDGLGILNTQNQEVTNYIFKEDLSSISSDKVQCFYAEYDSILWIGTSDGLNRFSLKSNEFKHYFTEDGLPSNSIKGIVKDDQGFLWLSTNYGISKFAHLLEEFKNFNKSDGLQGNQYNAASILKTKDNKILIGGVNGFNVFNPEKVELNKTPPQIVITDFKVDEKSMDWFDENNSNNHISESELVELKHNTSFFSISFVGLNFNSAKLNQYKYRLKGYDDDWYSADGVTVTYQGIPPGDYEFEVVGSNNHGVWSSTGAKLKITVLTPWWSTTIFRLILISVIGALAYLIIRARTNSLKRYHDKLKTLVKERTKELQSTTDQLQEKQEEVLNQNQKLELQKQELEKALNNLKTMQTQYVQTEKMASIGTLVAGIAHEINNPLQLINGGRDLINRDIKHEIEEEKAKHFRSSLDMIEQGINRAAAIVDSLNSFNNYSSKEEKICFVNEIIDNCLLVLKPELSGKVEVIKVYSDTIPEIKGSPGDLHQVFINILKNGIDSIKQKGSIKIETKSDTEYLEVIFHDNGEGINETDLPRILDPFFTTKDPGHGIGMGMSIAYQIIKKYNGDIRYTSKPNEGTEVRVLIKLNM